MTRDPMAREDGRGGTYTDSIHRENNRTDMYNRDEARGGISRDETYGDITMDDGSRGNSRQKAWTMVEQEEDHSSMEEGGRSTGMDIALEEWRG